MVADAFGKSAYSLSCSTNSFFCVFLLHCQIFKFCQIYLFLIASWNLHLIGSRHVATGTDFSTRFLAVGRGSTELEEK